MTQSDSFIAWERWSCGCFPAPAPGGPALSPLHHRTADERGFSHQKRPEPRAASGQGRCQEPRALGPG